MLHCVLEGKYIHTVNALCLYVPLARPIPLRHNRSFVWQITALLLPLPTAVCNHDQIYPGGFVSQSGTLKSHLPSCSVIHPIKLKWSFFERMLLYQHAERVNGICM